MTAWRLQTLERVQQDWERLAYVKAPFDDDMEIIAAAVQKSASAIHHVSPHVLARAESVERILAANPRVLPLLKTLATKHEGVMRCALPHFPELMERAPEKLRSDRELMVRMMEIDPTFYARVALKLREDRELSQLALSFRGGLLAHAPSKVRNDEALVKTAVTNDGMALEFASPSLCGAKAIVIGAVQHSKGRALQFASPALRNDPDVVTQAVLCSTDGDVFSWASDELKADGRLVTWAVMQASRPGVMKHAAPTMPDRKELLLQAAGQTPDISKCAWFVRQLKGAGAHISFDELKAIFRNLKRGENDFPRDSPSHQFGYFPATVAFLELLMSFGFEKGTMGHTHAPFLADRMSALTECCFAYQCVILHYAWMKGYTEFVRALLTNETLRSRIWHSSCSAWGNEGAYPSQECSEFKWLWSRSLATAMKLMWDTNMRMDYLYKNHGTLCSDGWDEYVDSLRPDDARFVTMARWAALSFEDNPEGEDALFKVVPAHLASWNSIMAEPRRLVLFHLGRRTPLFPELVRKIVIDAGLWRRVMTVEERAAIAAERKKKIDDSCDAAFAAQGA